MIIFEIDKESFCEVRQDLWPSIIQTQSKTTETFPGVCSSSQIKIHGKNRLRKTHILYLVDLRIKLPASVYALRILRLCKLLMYRRSSVFILQ